jgi:hypothetical protein
MERRFYLDRPSGDGKWRDLVDRESDFRASIDRDDVDVEEVDRVSQQVVDILNDELGGW